MTTRAARLAHRRQVTDNRRAVVVIVVASIAMAWVGATAGSADPSPEPVTVEVGLPYDAERWQDPSGHPYCVTPDDGMRPCIDSQTGVVTGRPLTTEEADALAEGDDTPPESADTRVWEDCLTDGATITCPDGFVTTQ